MLIEIGEDAPSRRSRRSCEAKLARKKKIPGFGHRVYRTEDPRATHLRQMSRDLGQRAGEPMWFEMSQRIEALVEGGEEAEPERRLLLGDRLSRARHHVDLFTPIFAVSRVSGWTAHVLEQYGNNRLIRPRAEYIGPEYPQRYVALDAR